MSQDPFHHQVHRQITMNIPSLYLLPLIGPPALLLLALLLAGSLSLALESEPTKPKLNDSCLEKIELCYRNQSSHL